MTKAIDPNQNYHNSMKELGYIQRLAADKKIYEDLGFKSGLEIHQQLKTNKKLFCRCPAGLYQNKEDYDAEIIRHMRPTLSELGEYDGTALMEFKTRKEIIYRLKNQSACTYDIDDTPPFHLNQEALENAMEIALLLKLNIVGEFHITRKQYLDGSIPTGFQRTGILGIEGSIPYKEKQINIIQLSIEEDSCREVSDIGHKRVYRTDRLGMPLIETVTYPEMLTPVEVAEVCQYLSYLARSTGKVRIGAGAGRQDVNVSINGGTRVEIKGVASIKAIPDLTHNEAFRQKALLVIKAKLLKEVKNPTKWKIRYRELDPKEEGLSDPLILDSFNDGKKIYKVTLPSFKSILSFFTQPGRNFAAEISDRLKVVACIEKPNMSFIDACDGNEARIIFWAEEADVKTALETIEERCQMAFAGVPNETRKAMPDGTTIFERVLPGADRMYPDTDSPPIPIPEELIETARAKLPLDLSERLAQLDDWKIPENLRHYILRNNLIPTIETLAKDLSLEAKFLVTIFSQVVKRLESKYNHSQIEIYKKVSKLIRFTRRLKLNKEIIEEMLPVLFENPRMDFESILITVGYKEHAKEEILSHIPSLIEMFEKINTSNDKFAPAHWVMGKLRKMAIGNMNLSELRKEVEAKLC
ncbi:MAG: Glu-tRNA(Gln) amidotransferase subunit GatE [Pseudomonadota bacterium]